ncbi:MAG: hypothetical protein R2817_04810 [Flavobacteriales bacterium]
MREVKDELHDLFQAAGHAVPEADLTDRIMARVAVTPVLRPTPVKPILDRRAWIAIILLTTTVLLCGLVGSANTASTSGPVSDAWRAASSALSSSGSWAHWLAGLSASLLVLAAVDRSLAGHHRPT